MRCYVDSSVLLRIVFGETKPLREWKKIEAAYSSALLKVEVSRTIDRARLAGQLDDEDVATISEDAKRISRSIRFVECATAILERASQPMPTVLGTLDAIHLASAIEAQRSAGADLIFATHDVQLARAARALGFTVVGTTA